MAWQSCYSGLLLTYRTEKYKGLVYVIQWLRQWKIIDSYFFKINLSSDKGLKLILMKQELLVIVGKHTTVNYLFESVQTAHQWFKINFA